MSWYAVRSGNTIGLNYARKELSRQLVNGINVVWVDSWPAGRICLFETKLCDALMWAGRGTDMMLINEEAGRFWSSKRIKSHHNWWGLRCMLQNCGGTIVQYKGSTRWQCSKCNKTVQ